MALSLYSELGPPEGKPQNPQPEQQEQQPPQLEPAPQPVETPPARAGRKFPLLALVAVAGAAAWWWWSASSLLDSRDLQFLPDHPLLIIHANVSQMEQSELLSDLKQLAGSFANSHLPGGPTPQLKELEGAVETVLVGVAARDSSPNSEDVIASGVIRCNRDVLLEQLDLAKFAEEPHVEELSDGRKVVSYGDNAFCQIDARTIAVGNVLGLKEVLQRQASPVLSDLMSSTLQQADFSQSLAVVAAGAAESVEQIQPLLGFSLPEAVVVSADFDADIRLIANLVMKSKDDIKALQQRMQPLLEMAKQQSAEATQLLESLEFSSSGTTLVVSAAIPGAPLVDLARGQANQLAAQFQATPALRLPQQASQPSAAQAVCRHNMARLNAAIEMYKGTTGEWPSSIEDLAQELGSDYPQFCDTHQVAYAIDPKTHRVLESTRPALAGSAAGDLTGSVPDPATAGPLLADSPQQLFAAVARAANDGELEVLLSGFTAAGQRAIASDLTESALQDIALGAHQSPEITEEFHELQKSQSPEFRSAEDHSTDERTDLKFLYSVSSFMQRHGIKFASLAEMYAPCAIQEVIIEDTWAIGNVRYDKDDLVREVILGFKRTEGRWQICVLEEIPSDILARLDRKMRKD